MELAVTARHYSCANNTDFGQMIAVLVRVDSEVNINQWNAKQISSDIVTRINNIYNRRIRDKDDRLLDEMFQLKLIGAKERQDVSLYFLCNQSEEVDRLEEMAKDGRLKEFAESFFNQLKIIQEEIKVTLKWKRDIFTRSRASIQGIIMILCTYIITGNNSNVMQCDEILQLRYY